TRDVVDPATGICTAKLAVATDADLDEAARSSASAFEKWKMTSPVERGAILRKAANMMREMTEEIAPVITSENGKTMAESRAEVAWAADYYDWFAEEARRTYGRVIPARAPGVRQLTV